MSNLTFNIKTSIDLYNKLLEDYIDFTKDPTSSRIALNCAMTAWHLTEWVYNEIEHKRYTHLKHFIDDMKKQCPSLQIMHDLTNGAKHHSLNHHKSKVKETKLHEGPFSNIFSREFDTSSLDIEINDGTKTYFEDEIVIVIDFWKSYLKL